MPLLLRLLSALLAGLLFTAPALWAAPVALDDRLIVELIAAQPDLVTPTGVAVDARGDIWVVENHTHQRPVGYKGHETDRIRVFSDFGPNGKARKIRTFADGFRDTMSLAFGPEGKLFVATRAALYQLRDRDGDGTADERIPLVRLETKGNYPHNGLAGFAFDAHDAMYFGLGENLGESYKLIGSDGVTLTGGGEGGSVYRCRPDGSKLARVATGFWNPYHQIVDAFGRLFIVDNDPDARGPCRLVHVVEGGDYGYRFRYGRKGHHPFVCWNGELPGTLPMASGTAEAPSGFVAYESDGLPEDYRGKLLVTSWGDHVVENFTLSPRGASVQASSKVMLRGGQDFRPVGIAVAPDGSLVVSDWVDKSYPVHGKGALWRVRAKNPPAKTATLDDVAAADVKRLHELLDHPRIEVRRSAARRLAQSGELALDAPSVRARLEALWASGHAGTEGETRERKALTDPAGEVRAEAVRLLGGRLDAAEVRRALHDKDPIVQHAALRSLSQQNSAEAVRFLDSEDPFLYSAAVKALAHPSNVPLLRSELKHPAARRRLGALLALRQAGEEGRSALPELLADADPSVRRAAIQWVGEEGLKDHVEALRTAAAKAPVSREVFTAWLAAESLLAGAKPNQDEMIEESLLRVLRDGKRPAAVQAMALRMLRPDHPSLKSDELAKFVAGRDAELRDEAIRSLAMRSDDAAQAQLRDVVRQSDIPLSLRLTATAGLGRSAQASDESRRVLLGLLEQKDLRSEALRSLRGVKDAEIEKRIASLEVPTEPRPTTPADWQKALAVGGDAEAGERLFFHARGPNCSTCHRIDGRGGETGPDLSVIARTFDRERLVKAILTPSAEIQPRYVAWRILTRDGRVRTGTLALEGHDSTLTLVDAEGKMVKINRLDVEEREALPTSIMPDNLHTLMTVEEFRDLIAYLAGRR